MRTKFAVMRTFNVTSCLLAAGMIAGHYDTSRTEYLNSLKIIPYIENHQKTRITHSSNEIIVHCFLDATGTQFNPEHLRINYIDSDVYSSKHDLTTVQSFGTLSEGIYDNGDIDVKKSDNQLHELEVSFHEIGHGVTHQAELNVNSFNTLPGIITLISSFIVSGTSSFIYARR